jgi:hypothetical protein
VYQDPASVEHILKGNFDNYPKGPIMRAIFKPLLGQVGLPVHTQASDEDQMQRVTAC